MKINSLLRSFGIGSAKQAGRKRAWEIEVTINSRFRNQRLMDTWFRAKANVAHVLTNATAVYGLEVCRASIRCLLYARWLAPQEMRWRAGLVPKELWVQNILKRVYETRYEDVWVWGGALFDNFHQKIEPLKQNLKIQISQLQ